MIRYYEVFLQHPNPYIREMANNGRLIINHNNDVGDFFDYSVLIRTMSKREEDNILGDLSVAAYDVLKRDIPKQMSFNSALFSINQRETEYSAHILKQCIEQLLNGDIIRQSDFRVNHTRAMRYWMNPQWCFFGSLREYVLMGLK